MADRIEKKEFVRRVAERMGTDEAVATAWVDGMLDEMYSTFESRHGLTLPGFGGFYLERRGRSIRVQVQSEPAAFTAAHLPANH